MVPSWGSKVDASLAATPASVTSGFLGLQLHHTLPCLPLHTDFSFSACLHLRFCLLSGQVFMDSGPTWIVQDDLIWGSLMTSAKHFPNQVIRGFLVDISFSETAIDPLQPLTSI